jgi:hypothetical protein
MTESESTAELRPSFPVDASVVSDQRSPHVLICLHGIRDNAAWCTEAQSEIISASTTEGFVQNDFIIACITYKRLSSFDFILGRKRLEIQHHVIAEINSIKKDYPESMISILAHSNGTKIIAEIIDKFDFKFEWIFLCGSVCHLNDVQKLRQINRYPVNDAATRDWWPIIAEAMRKSLYQATGVYGFNTHPILDRLFSYKHGGATRRQHIGRWILPALSKGAPERTKFRDVGWKKHAPTYLRRGMFLIFILTIALLLDWLSALFHRISVD